MSHNQQHIIRKQTLDLELLGTESQGLVLQQELPQVMAQYVSPAIENVFNRYSNLREHITIDYLEIDVGNLSLERLEQDLAGQVEQCLEKALRERMLSIQHPDVLSQNEDEISDAEGNVKLRTYSQSVRTAFIYFLRTGRLPWSFQLAEGERLEDAILDVWQNSAPSQLIFWQVDVRALLANEDIRKRLVLQFSTTFLDKLLALLLPNSHQALSGIAILINQLEVDSTDKKVLTQLFWQVTARHMATDDVVNAKEVLQQIAVLVPRQVLVKNESQLLEFKKFFERYDVKFLPQDLNALKSKDTTYKVQENGRKTDSATNKPVNDNEYIAEFGVT